MCIFFLLHFTIEKHPVCYLEHYSFIDVDESKLSPQETLVFLLNRISENIRDILTIDFISLGESSNILILVRFSY
jgi:hypothetical protein